MHSFMDALLHGRERLTTTLSSTENVDGVVVDVAITVNTLQFLLIDTLLVQSQTLIDSVIESVYAKFFVMYCLMGVHLNNVKLQK